MFNHIVTYCFRHFLVVGLLSINLTLSVNASDIETEDTLINWKPWSQEAFNQAKREHKFVLLNLEAVWCHWCHVMDQKTYSNPAVAAMMNKHFISTKVDHDARPDLAQRYREYGWPATIILAADGTEIVKRAGFMQPENFLRLLQAIVNDPTPEPASIQLKLQKHSESAVLTNVLDKELRKRRLETYDKKLGGYKNTVKFLEEAYIEYAILKAATGEKFEEEIAKTTLNSALALIDPAWGGMYQYSTYNDWQHPHFEKIMTTQARAIKLYANAYSYWKDHKHLEAAKKVAQYLTEFLLDKSGAFYTSQDADLIQGIKGHDFFDLDEVARREKGMPRIDKHIYAQENGWAIEAFATLHETTGDPVYLRQAIKAAQWIITNRSISINGVSTGGFSHDQLSDKENQVDRNHYLGDNLAMAKAFLQLYRSSAERYWLNYATQTVNFIEQKFRGKDAGFYTANLPLSPVPPIVHTDENIALVRLCNLLFHYTGNNLYKKMAEHGMRWLVTPSIALQRIEESGILLTAFELANDPLHLTITGRKDNKQAQRLYDVALRTPGRFKRIEWWDAREGALPNPDIEYPSLSQPAAFVCTNGRCSVPAFNEDDYRSNIKRLTQ